MIGLQTCSFSKNCQKKRFLLSYWYIILYNNLWNDEKANESRLKNLLK
jgi:hypothetical protein